MFGLWQTVQEYVTIRLVNGGVDLWVSYGFLLCSWIVFTIGMRLHVKLKTKSR